jgi:hypothetical protein
MEIEVRAGFCDPGGEFLAVLERSGWQRIAEGRYKQMIDYALGLSHGIFT